MVAWRRRAWLIVALAVGLTVGLTACGPEANRSRGGGDGGDIGNRKAIGTPVEFAGGTEGDERIYYRTPRK